MVLLAVHLLGERTPTKVKIKPPRLPRHPEARVPMLPAEKEQYTPDVDELESDDRLVAPARDAPVDPVVQLHPQPPLPKFTFPPNPVAAPWEKNTETAAIEKVDCLSTDKDCLTLP